MAEVIERPGFVTNTHLEYLDRLRDRGTTNMLGAGTYLVATFSELNDDSARKVLRYWMDTFGDPSR